MDNDLAFVCLKFSTAVPTQYEATQVADPGHSPHPSSPPQPLSTLSHRPLGQSPYGWHTATRQSAGAKKRTEGPNRGSDQQDQQDNTQSNNARKTAASTPAPACNKHTNDKTSRQRRTAGGARAKAKRPIEAAAVSAFLSTRTPKSARERRFAHHGNQVSTALQDACRQVPDDPQQLNVQRASSRKP